MSAAFRLSKKKHTQNDLRKLMNEQKNKVQTEKNAKRIDSPLAKYNEAGQLTCILCKSIVRSEDVWKVHVNAKQHKENVIFAKQLKEKTENFTIVPLKRSQLPPENDVPEKKIKGILKNSGISESSTLSAKSDDKELPSDFFDTKSKKFNNFRMPAIPALRTPTPTKTPTEPSDELPEGFFDDPIQDAKVRNLEYKDPIEEEWEKFQKEMREEATVSSAIIAEDQDEATNDRQIDEIDEQMRNWSRVLVLEKKIQEVIIAEKTKTQQMEIDESEMIEEIDEDDDFDEFLDWRAKKLK